MGNITLSDRPYQRASQTTIKFDKGMVLLITSIIAAVTLYFAYTNYNSKTNYITTNATIVGNVTCNGSDSGQGLNYNCVFGVSYTTKDNKQFTNSITVNSKYANYTAGQTISVEYDPENPTNVRIPSLSNKSMAVILIAIGVLIGSYGLYNYTKN